MLRHHPGEELWIIQKPTAMVEASDKETPGCGQLCAKLPEEEKEVPLPLKHTDVAARIAGYIATVDVTQQYHNPYDTKIEAVYVFPLPQNAAVNEFVMTVGERRIRGIIREREEAEEIYREARRQGYVASLLTQERPNIFTQSVANIEPGKQIDINIKYFHTLAYADGWYEFVFPMVVGPRFNPPGFSDPVRAVGRGSPAANRARSASEGTTVEYLKPNERSGHDVALTVDIDAGVEIEDVQSHNHVVAVHQPSPSQAEVKLNPNDSIPNKDFVLRYKVAGQRIKSAFVTHRDERGGYFTLMVYPPESLWCENTWCENPFSHPDQRESLPASASGTETRRYETTSGTETRRYASLPRKPMEMIFVLDCSGSMSGKPIAQAKTAVERALRHMQPDDTFQIIRFSNNASQLGPKPIEATPENIRKGLRYVKSLHGGGGTMMIEGMKAALDFPHDPRRLRVVTFLTDGFIGNEREILGEVHKRLGDTRIFSFGVGSSPNRYLLERMAKLGCGVVAYVGLNDSAAEVIDLFFERISHPAMTDLAIDWGGLRVFEVFPQRLPDLFVGRPVILTGRCDGELAAPIRITGTVADGRHEITVPATGESAGATHDGLPFVWARMKIADLYDRATYDDNNELPQLVKATALEYGLMSAYTAFVAVDSLTRTAGDYGTTVAVPVPVPEGVRYETTVSD